MYVVLLSALMTLARLMSGGEDPFDTLSPAWTFTDPFPPDATATTKGGWLEISVHGHEYDGWRTGNNFATLLQPVKDQPKMALDCTLDPKIVANGCSGIMLCGATRNDFFRWELENRSGGVKYYAATIVNGVATARGTNPAAPADVDGLRIERDGDNWMFLGRAKSDGQWKLLVSFTQSFTVTLMGVYAGGHQNVASTSRFDSFSATSLMTWPGDEVPPSGPIIQGRSCMFSLRLERDLRKYYATQPTMIPMPPGAYAPDPLMLAVGRLLIGDLKDEELKLRVLKEMLQPPKSEPKGN